MQLLELNLRADISSNTYLPDLFEKKTHKLLRDVTFPNRKTNLVGQDNYARSQKHIILTCTSSLCFLLLSY